MIFSARSRRPFLVSIVCGIYEARRPGLLVNGHAERINRLAQGGMRPNIRNHLLHATKQPGIVQDRLAHFDAVLGELPSFAHQPAGVGQGPYRNGPIVSRHAAEFTAGQKRRSCAQLGGS
jgi:hypothetical protein